MSRTGVYLWAVVILSAATLAIASFASCWGTQ